MKPRYSQSRTGYSRTQFNDKCKELHLKTRFIYDAMSLLFLNDKNFQDKVLSQYLKKEVQ